MLTALLEFEQELAAAVDKASSHAAKLQLKRKGNMNKTSPESSQMEWQGILQDN
jgi:hypothetical protein